MNFSAALGRDDAHSYIKSSDQGNHVLDMSLSGSGAGGGNSCWSAMKEILAQNTSPSSSNNSSNDSSSSSAQNRSLLQPGDQSPSFFYPSATENTSWRSSDSDATPQFPSQHDWQQPQRAVNSLLNANSWNFYPASSSAGPDNADYLNYYLKSEFCCLRQSKAYLSSN
ncbi:hypothetical protein Ciccas_014289 [Cichlidogyrus casuarinus]|uniref:Uncharacterized protein n=1 Tax=Cichlidogyrus casuarinus TaxID=1844966 RepID=A0ABD2PJ38_9PLAT